MRGLFTVNLRGQNLYVNVVHDKVDLLGTRGEVLDWEITAGEWLDIIKAAENGGFNSEDWYYRDAREDDRNIAIACMLEALNDRLTRGARHSAEAFELIKDGARNGAIGAIAELNTILDEAKALFGATLAFHQSASTKRPLTVPSESC